MRCLQAVVGAVLCLTLVGQAPTAESRPGSSPPTVHVSGKIVTPAGFPVEWTKVLAKRTAYVLGYFRKDIRVEAPISPSGEWSLDLDRHEWTIEWSVASVDQARVEVSLSGGAPNGRVDWALPTFVAPDDLCGVEVTDTEGGAVAKAEVASIDDGVCPTFDGDRFLPFSGVTDAASTDEHGHAVVRTRRYRSNSDATTVGVVARGYRFREVPLVPRRVRVTLDRAVSVRLTPRGDLAFPAQLNGHRLSAEIVAAPANRKARLPHQSLTTQGGRSPISESRPELRALMTPGTYTIGLNIGYGFPFDKMANPYARCEHLELLSRVTIPDTRDEVEIAVPIDPADLAAALKRLAKQK